MEKSCLLCHIQAALYSALLENTGFAQLVSEATHYKGRHIDHVYSNHDVKCIQVDVSLYSPYYLAKDHDAICITLTKVPERILPGRGKYSVKK